MKVSTARDLLLCVVMVLAVATAYQLGRRSGLDEQSDSKVKSKPSTAPKSESPAPSCDEAVEHVGALALADVRHDMTIRYGKEAAARLEKDADLEPLANAREAFYKACTERPSIYNAEVRQCVLAAKVIDDASTCWDRALKKAAEDAEAKAGVGAPTCEQAADHQVELIWHDEAKKHPVKDHNRYLASVRDLRAKLVRICKDAPWPPDMRRCVMAAPDPDSTTACATKFGLK